MKQEVARGVPLVRSELVKRGFRGNTLSEMAKPIDAFFGYRLLAPYGLLAGIAGAAVATAALLLPSFFLLTTALQGLEKWKRSRLVQGILFGVRPATSALILQAGLVFAGLSVWKDGFNPFAACLAVLAGTLLLTRKFSVMATICLCAALGASGACVAHSLL